MSVQNARQPRLPGVRIYRPRDLVRADRTRLEGVPVTTPTRTLIDLAAVVHIDAVEEALDDALSRRVTSLPLIERRLTALARKGRPGITAFRELLEVRSHGDPVAESPFETRLLREMRRAGLPEPVGQHTIYDRGGFVARVDFAYPHVKLAIEADGYRYHSGRARFESDRARLNALTALGWRVIHVTWAQLRDEPDTLIAQIAGTLADSR